MTQVISYLKWNDDYGDKLPGFVPDGPYVNGLKLSECPDNTQTWTPISIKYNDNDNKPIS